MRKSYAVVDRLSANILGEFDTRAEAEDLLRRLVKADQRAATFLHIYREVDDDSR